MGFMRLKYFIHDCSILKETDDPAMKQNLKNICQLTVTINPICNNQELVAI